MKQKVKLTYSVLLSQEKSKMAGAQTTSDLEQTMLFLTPLLKPLEVQGVDKPPEL